MFSNRFCCFFLLGYGWLTVTIYGVTARRLESGGLCDNGLGGHVECDPYVKIFINGFEDFQTSKKQNAPYAYFCETFKTPLMRKTDPIKFEVWDDDSGFFGSDDDFMFGISTNVDQLLPINYRQPYHYIYQHNEIDYNRMCKINDSSYPDFCIETRSNWLDEYTRE